MAFLTVKDGNVKLLNLNGATPIDRLTEVIPDVITKASDIINKVIDNCNQKKDSVAVKKEVIDSDNNKTSTTEFVKESN